jgi:ATP-dependent DNA ligase
MRKGIMLCYPFEERRLLKWRAPWVMQRKLDGERCRALVNGLDVRLFSSEENEIKHLPHINEALSQLNLWHKELDGELYSHGMDFSDIHSIVSRKVNPHPEYLRMEYHIFDIVNSDNQYCRSRDLDRLRGEIIRKGLTEELKVVGHTLVDNLDTIMSIFEDYMTDGYEGFILRDGEALYKRARSTQIMKFKPHQEDVYEIIGSKEEISIEGVPKNALGAFTCIGDDSTPFTIGSGPLLTRDLRVELWKDKETLVGKYLKVKYQNLTQGRGIPRFPVAVQVLDLKGLVD